MEGEPNEEDIMREAKLHLQQLQPMYNCVGTSVDAYQFNYVPKYQRNSGVIFSASNAQQLTFHDGTIASSEDNKREALFLTHEAIEKKEVEDMMVRSITLKSRGILRSYIAGYNTQISKVVSAYRVTSIGFGDWLEAERKKGPLLTSIPDEVKEIIRIAYLAVEAIRVAGSTSSRLDEVSSYHMIENRIKIDPMCIRDRDDEDDDMVPRNAFGDMILNHIYRVWKDEELRDFVDLLKNPEAREDHILGAPVLLLPDSRELMYHRLHKTPIRDKQLAWMEANGTPQPGWIERAKNRDPTLKKIIDERRVPFPTDFKGALQFANVVTAHYLQYFQKTPEGESGADVKDRVDSLLKEVLPRLLSRRYNAQYIRSQ